MPFDPDTIYKALRPVPEFDGNPNVLTRFIKLCDQLVLQYVQTGPGSELNNESLLNGILNKITGNAARTLNSNGIPDSWIGIRNALINNFADRRDETSLYSDLSLISQGNDTPQELYDRCQTLLSTIMTYVSLHEHIPTTIEAKRDLYRKLALKSFLKGLNEPLGSRIRCMRPETIEKALEFVQEESNVMYLQKRIESNHDKRINPNMHNTNLPPKPINLGLPGPSWQKAPIYQPPPLQGWRPAFQYGQPQRPNYQVSPPQRFPSMMPSRTQQMFRAPPPNYNNSGFRVPPRATPQQGPKPMSGVSHYVAKPMAPVFRGHDWAKFGNPPPSNYLKSNQINFNETYNYSDDYNYSDFYNEPCEPYYNYDYAPNYYDYYEPDPYASEPYSVIEPQSPDQPAINEVETSLTTGQDFHKGRSKAEPK